MTADTGNKEQAFEALLDLLHRLNGEYRQIQEAVDVTANAELRAGKNLAEVIAEMSRRSEELRASQQPLIEVLNGTLRDLCGVYLEAGGDLRERIRGAFTGQRMLLVHLINLTGTACLSIPQGDGAYWLRTALAAVSIEDNRTDPRDTTVALQYLYSAAIRAGLEPRPHFDEVATLSSDAMRKFLTGFACRYT